MRRWRGAVKDQRQRRGRQRSFPCSEAGGNNGLLDHRARLPLASPSSTQVGWPIHKSLLFLRALSSLTSSNDALCKGMRRRPGGGGGREMEAEVRPYGGEGDCAIQYKLELCICAPISVGKSNLYVYLMFCSQMNP